MYTCKLPSLHVLPYNDETSLEDVKLFIQTMAIPLDLLEIAADKSLIIKVTGGQAIIIPLGMTICVSQDKGMIMGLAPQLLEVFYEKA